MFLKLLLVFCCTSISVCSSGTFNECVAAQAVGKCNKITKATIVVIIDDDHFNKSLIKYSDEYKVLLNGFFKSANFSFAPSKVYTMVIGRKPEDRAAIAYKEASVHEDPVKFITEIIPPVHMGSYNDYLNDAYLYRTRINSTTQLAPLSKLLENGAMFTRSEDDKAQTIFLIVSPWPYQGILQPHIDHFLSSHPKEKYLLFLITMDSKPAPGSPIPPDGVHLFFKKYDDEHASMEEVGGDIAQCMCSMFDDCQWQLETGPCHFTISLVSSKEICVKYSRKVVVHRGTQRGVQCPSDAAESTECEIKHCQDDCDLKGWMDWSACYCENVKIRWRKNQSASQSYYTESCPEYLYATCSATKDCSFSTSTSTTTTTTALKSTAPSTIVTTKYHRGFVEATTEQPPFYEQVGFIVILCILGVLVFVVVVVLVFYFGCRKKKNSKRNLRIMVNKTRESRRQHPADTHRSAKSAVSLASSIAAESKSRTRTGRRHR